ncbi:recombinase family protein [Paenibacillus cookii]|uniref:Resolvase n=1 Tax=Paenibacillus cookii TaxID=157839 RepID=A0ABQ4M3N5_9BACL|nr:recombinase family protein [Paenibacillus cookii]GIO70147.1 resolvase [Paenibacillus cookii]
MNKIAVYVRVSTEEQALEGFSIEGQLKMANEFCSKRNYEIVAVYKDEGITGTSIESRHDVRRLLSDSNKNIFDAVLVWKYNRLARNQKDFLNMLDVFEKNNVRVISCTEDIDISTPMGKMMLQMLGSFAEFERNVIVENVKMGMKTRAKKGLWNGGSMLGYKSENKKLVIVEEEAFIVREAFKLYVSGKGFKSIAHEFNRLGYKTKRGQAFSITSIRTIITNPAYAGLIRFNKQQDWNEKRRKGTNPEPIIVVGEHEPIISMETWNKAQELFKLKSSKPTKTFDGHFPLTTLLRCPKCGQGMIGHRSKRTKNSDEYIRYYICGNSHYKGSAVCRANSIRADYAEQYVYSKLEEIATNDRILKSLVDNVNRKITTLKEPIKSQYEITLEEIKKVRSNAEKYLRLFENDAMDIVFVKEKVNRLNEELKLLESRKVDLERQLAQPTVRELSFNEVYGILSNFSKLMEITPPEQQKTILNQLISKITINAGERIEQRSIKDIELFFDATQNTDFVLTYDTVHRDLSSPRDKSAR